MKHRHRLLMAGLGVVALAMALTLIAAWGQGSLAANGIIYVDADAGGANDGSTWANAYTTLQPALEAAGTGDQIWVAEGIYTPTWEFSPGDPRSATFQMKNGVAIYGGFDPSVGDTEWEDRDWVSNVVILSGDLDGDDGPDFANNGENSYNVFLHDRAGLDSTAILDGFTISGGNANVIGDYAENGGGMWNNYGSSPTLTNCTFKGNSASWGGGGMANQGSSPALTNCTFAGNSAGLGGGGMYNSSSSPTLTNCTFAGNSGNYGGGMHNFGRSSPVLTNCTFSGNLDSYAGGGMYNDYDSSPTLANCTFSGNSARENGAGMYNYESSPTLTNCTFSGNWASYDGGGLHNSDRSSPTLTNCILWGDTAGGLPSEIFNDDPESTPVVTYSDIQGGYPGDGNINEDPLFVDPDNGDYHLQLGSPCIDAGDNDAPELPGLDFDREPRILDVDGDGIAIVDMGVDEFNLDWPSSRVYLPLVFRGY